MPRPGPRPYECVRRAWHSDRHQPIRGSLIQEIFRVVNEIHSSATKKNREWQEKLPIVVLKAEEIMYSKANSEAEYMDPKTLWDRANDAINTIIRRDESSETGGFLQPCIEAALNLGCTPRRASRSQRNNNQRCYLNPNNQESTSNLSIILDNKTQGIHSTTLDHTSYPSLVNFQTMKLTPFGLEPVCFVPQNNNCSDNKFPSSSHYFPPSNNHCLSKETCQASKSYSVYPLYYGNNLQVDESQLGFEIPPKSNSSAVEPADMGIIQNHFPYDADASKKTRQTEPGDTPENQPFDLSLRLAPLSVPCSTHNSLSLKVEDVISSKSQEGIKSSNLLPQMGKGFSFFHLGNADVPSDSCLSKWSPQEATMRKRKTIVSHPTEERILCSPPKHQRFHFTTLMEE